MLWNKSSATNRAWGGDGERNTLEQLAKKPWTSLRLERKKNSLSANEAAGILAVEMSLAS
jgi:hypothetical protein